MDVSWYDARVESDIERVVRCGPRSESSRSWTVARNFWAVEQKQRAAGGVCIIMLLLPAKVAAGLAWREKSDTIMIFSASCDQVEKLLGG